MKLHHGKHQTEIMEGMAEIIALAKDIMEKSNHSMEQTKALRGGNERTKSVMDGTNETLWSERLIEIMKPTNEIIMERANG